MGWQLHGGRSLAGAGLAVASQMSLARALPGSQQGSCRGVAVVPGNGSPRQGSRRGPPSSDSHLISHLYGLDKDLHATTQVLAELAQRPPVATRVPAQLVELAAAWGRRWSLGRRGPGYGPADALGKGLAGSPARVLPWRCSRPRQGACRRSCGSPRQGSRRGSPSSSSNLILYL